MESRQTAESSGMQRMSFRKETKETLGEKKLRKTSVYVEHHQIVTSKDAAVETSAAIIIKSTTDRVVGGCDRNRTGRDETERNGFLFFCLSLVVPCSSCLPSFGFPFFAKDCFHCLLPFASCAEAATAETCFFVAALKLSPYDIRSFTPFSLKMDPL